MITAKGKRTDRVWTGWDGLLLWRELVPVFREEEAELTARVATLGGYILASPSRNRRRDLLVLALRPSAAS
jgi:hypothetical protein